MLVNVRLEHLSFDSRMFAIRFDVHREILVVVRIAEAVVFLQTVDFRFTDLWNLTFVRVQRRQTFCSRCVVAN